jgi:hypothetical protein
VSTREQAGAKRGAPVFMCIVSGMLYVEGVEIQFRSHITSRNHRITKKKVVDLNRKYSPGSNNLTINTVSSGRNHQGEAMRCHTTIFSNHYDVVSFLRIIMMNDNRDERGSIWCCAGGFHLISNFVFRAISFNLVLNPFSYDDIYYIA